ncbi:cytochrome P450 [Hypoxylon sp. FL1150]|nr:cytochrome P450 [Hypoxylon sp. FL1150]
MTSLTIASDFSTQTIFITIVLGAVFVYGVSRPRIAAIPVTWDAHHWLSGRYPWNIEHALHKYGPVKNPETFVETRFQNRGKDLGGMIWEEDPVHHHEQSIHTNMEPLVHKYIDSFILDMEEIGTDGICLVQWTHWLTVDFSADLAWNTKLNQMEDMKDSVHLDVVLSCNKYATVLQVFKRFPLLAPFQYLFALMGKVRLFAQMDKVTRDSVLQRINQRGTQSIPSDPRELLNSGSVDLQVMFAGWGPMVDLFYETLALLVREPDCYKALVEEIRTHFTDYESMTLAILGSLPYLHAYVEETLRMLPSNNTGLPRISPGAVVDGYYTPKGIHVQSCIWALARSPTYFYDLLRFRPQLWLTPSHSLYDSSFVEDGLKSLYLFSLGLCIFLGREMAWLQAKLTLAKVFWTFDVVKIPGQRFDLDNILLNYGFFEKVELKV